MIQAIRSAKTFLVVCGGLTLLASAGQLLADSPQVIRYQAHLTDPAGVPIDGTRDLTFRLYDQAVGGAQLWTEPFMSVDINNGSVEVLLGTTAPLTPAILSGTEHWLEVAVDGAVLSPRQRLASTPFALNADRLGTKTLTEVNAEMDSRITTHTAIPAAHHTKTTDAAELTSGFLDPTRIAPDSLGADKVIDGAGSGLDSDLVDGLHANEIIDAQGAPLDCFDITYQFGFVGSTPSGSCSTRGCAQMNAKTFPCPPGTALFKFKITDSAGTAILNASPDCTTPGTSSLAAKCVSNSSLSSCSTSTVCGVVDGPDTECCSSELVTLTCCQ